MNRIKYPIGIQTFSKIREEGYLYVDKTEYLHKLIKNGAQFAFLSRPRRFGKSLFITMAEEFFKGNKALFEGLSISRHAYDWQVFPVLHFDFSGCPVDSDESMSMHLDYFLKMYERKYGIVSDACVSVSRRFREIIYHAHEQTGRKVVVLIDEYDKPLLDTVDNPERQDVYRQQLRSFYGNLKSQDAYIKFAMLTGVTKFGHLSIFSDLNNLEDISMDEEFSGICGISSYELHQYLDSGVQELATRRNLTKEEAYELLRINYDGYHFSPDDAMDIYNPFSIINALKSRRISNYWFQTGTPTFLVKLIKKRGLQLSKLDNIEVDADAVSSLSFDYLSSLYPVLYQSGYLTIKGYRPDVNRLHLGFPNREVEQGFYTQLMKIYIPSAESDMPFSIIDFYDDIVGGRAEEFMTRLQGLFSDFNQDGFNHIEIEQHYQDVVFIIMKLMGFHTHIEYKTASGRIDLVVKTPKYINVFEFKINKSALEAMEQIDSKDYLLPFKSDHRRLIKIGANFSDAIHSLDSWIIEEV